MGAGAVLPLHVFGQDEVLVRKYDPDKRRVPAGRFPVRPRRPHHRGLAQAGAGPGLRYEHRGVGHPGRRTLRHRLHEPGPDMDVNSTGLDYHRWCVEHMADLCIRLAQEPHQQATEMGWARLFRPGSK